ncbi:hypothetical protein DRO27_03675 [Candidatus Bathyarchaeota archaeon]|nr:MAG: hypothetical protein DRO27_03675 [Candidatus Bathyarchaeota archaeon]
MKKFALIVVCVIVVCAVSLTAVAYVVGSLYGSTQTTLSMDSPYAARITLDQIAIEQQLTSVEKVKFEHIVVSYAQAHKMYLGICELPGMDDQDMCQPEQLKAMNLHGMTYEEIQEHTKFFQWMVDSNDE